MTSWMTGVCDVPGTRMHYLRTGGAGRPLVLLHGLTASGACWSPLACSLEDRFDVVMPDARGHGKSSAPPHGYRYDDHASDVLGLIRALRLAAPILVGHSMGGMTAALVASQMGEAVSGVVLVDPTFLSAQRQREVCDSDVVGEHRRLLSLGREGIAAEARSRHPQRSSEIVELLAEARVQTRMSAFDVLTPPSPDYQQVVIGIPVPILLIIGDAPVVSLQTARELQALNSHVQVEQIDDAGHGVPFDQPDRFAAVLRAFLDQGVPTKPWSTTFPSA